MLHLVPFGRGERQVFWAVLGVNPDSGTGKIPQIHWPRLMSSRTKCLPHLPSANFWTFWFPLFGTPLLVMAPKVITFCFQVVWATEVCFPRCVFCSAVCPYSPSIPDSQTQVVSYCSLPEFLRTLVAFSRFGAHFRVEAKGATRTFSFFLSPLVPFRSDP